MSGKSSGKRRSLADDALVVFPVISDCYKLYISGQMHDYDLVGLFILTWLAVSRPNTWSNGKLKETIVDKNSNLSMSVKIVDLPESAKQIIGIKYLAKKLSISEEKVQHTTIMGILNQLQLSGIKHNSDNYINRCIVMWSVGKRPARLLFHIPSPMEVLRQQAAGERVVTMFVTLPELSTTHNARLAYMRGMQLHSKDPFEFLVHDLKHMEHFVEPATHTEQIGFFRCMLALNGGKPRHYFTRKPVSQTSSSGNGNTCSGFSSNGTISDGSNSNRKNMSDGTPDVSGNITNDSHSTHYCSGSHGGLCLDEELWRELEYVISDMNCYSTHLLRYLYAKLYSAVERRVLLLRGVSATSAATDADPAKAQEMGEDRSAEVTTDGREESTVLTATTTEREIDDKTSAAPAAIEDSAEDTAASDTEVERATERDWHSVLLSLGMQPLSVGTTEGAAGGTVAAPTTSDYELLRSRAMEINIGGVDGEAARFVDPNETYSTTDSDTTRTTPAPEPHEARHEIITWSQQVAHLSYHSCMSLLAVSRRERREWAESEAEAVRLFFQMKGVSDGLCR